jgi:hypothetical protein
MQGCKQLHKLVLPLQLDVAPLLAGRSHSLEQDEEQERQVLLLHKAGAGMRSSTCDWLARSEVVCT